MCSSFLQGYNQIDRVDIQRQAEHISSSPAIALPCTYIQKQLWSLLPFNLNKYYWFAGWLNNDFYYFMSLVIPVIPVDLHIPNVRISECKHVMAGICVG